MSPGTAAPDMSPEPAGAFIAAMMASARTAETVTTGGYRTSLPRTQDRNFADQHGTPRPSFYGPVRPSAAFRRPGSLMASAVEAGVAGPAAARELVDVATGTCSARACGRGDGHGDGDGGVAR